jgi:2-isopropylmalate synthase
VIKFESAYQHVDPAVVGNQRRLLVSELGGSRGLLDKLGDLGIDYPLSRDEARSLTETIKEQEAQGYQYEGADASLEMLVRRTLPGYAPAFNLDDFWVVLRRSERAERKPPTHRHSEMQAEAMVKVRIFGRGGAEDELRQTAADGDGPVDALDHAVRKALGEFYPGIDNIRLVDYKVRVVDSNAGTGASVRVLIECSDETDEWLCVGASTDIVEASWLALADAYEWWLLRHPA